MKSGLNSARLYKLMPSWNYDRWGEREYAALALSEIGPAASNSVPPLITSIDKTEVYETDKSKGATSGATFSSQARAEAVRALGKIAPDSTEVVGALTTALHRLDRKSTRLNSSHVAI